MSSEITMFLRVLFLLMMPLAVAADQPLVIENHTGQEMKIWIMSRAKNNTKWPKRPIHSFHGYPAKYYVRDESNHLVVLQDLARRESSLGHLKLYSLAHKLREKPLQLKVNYEVVHEMKTRNVTKLKTEQRTREVPYTVMVPETRTRTVDVMRTVQETRYRTITRTDPLTGRRETIQEPYTVSTLVPATVKQTYTVNVPEQRSRTETYTVAVPVTEEISYRVARTVMDADLLVEINGRKVSIQEIARDAPPAPPTIENN